MFARLRFRDAVSDRNDVTTRHVRVAARGIENDLLACGDDQAWNE